MSSGANFSFSSMALLILLVAFADLFLSPTISTSRHRLDQSTILKTGFKATLKHVDHGKNLTKIELLQRMVGRGRKRMDMLQAIMSLAESSHDNGIISPVYGGHYVGEFLMNLSIGTPPLSYSASIDTGSDLIWTQCKPCLKCFNQSTPIFDPNKSYSYSKLNCSSNLCKALPSSSCINNGYCKYEYSYGSGTTRGDLATETFTFDEKVKVPKLGFGCAVNITGHFDAGILGLGRGDLSLVLQLHEHKFSYCLPSSFSDKTGVLSVGSRVNSSNNPHMKTTPLFKTPLSKRASFYYLSLQGITINRTRLAIRNSTFALNHTDGTGGLFIDSGTSRTHLEKSAFDKVKKELSRQINLPTTSGSDFNLDLCFKISHNVKRIGAPKIIFHFKGADLVLPPKSYLVKINDGRKRGQRVCLMMGASPFSDGASNWGNFQQQKTLVVYDLANEKLSFMANAHCDQM